MLKKFDNVDNNVWFKLSSTGLRGHGYKLFGIQSTRHTPNSSHGHVVNRHIVLVNSLYGQLVTGNSPQAD